MTWPGFVIRRASKVSWEFGDDPVFTTVAPSLLRKVFRKNATFCLRFSVFEASYYVEGIYVDTSNRPGEALFYVNPGGALGSFFLQRLQAWPRDEDQKPWKPGNAPFRCPSRSMFYIFCFWGLCIGRGTKILMKFNRFSGLER